MKILTPRFALFRTRKPAGFSLLEIMFVVAAISTVAALAFVTFSGSHGSVKNVKLRQDTAALNQAVRTYLMNGGDLSTATDGEAVLAKLKTIADSASRSKIAGLRGSMIDLRLKGVASSAPGEFKAVWDAGKQTFIVQKPGSGFSEFELDSREVPPVQAEESRKTALAMNNEDKWIWSFKDETATKSGPGAQPATVDTPVPTPGSDVHLPVLTAPSFSKPAGLYSVTAFDPNMPVHLVDSNPPNTAVTYYSIANGPWIEYTGSPIAVPLALSTEVRAFSAPLDPDRYEESATNASLYETIFFGGSSTGLFQNPTGDPGLVCNLLQVESSPNMTWGSPAAGIGQELPNSLTFTGNSFSSVAPDQTFALGTLTYYNGTIYSGTSASSVELHVNLNLTTPGVVESLPFTFNLLSTVNTKASKLANPNNTETEQQMDDADADFVYIPQVSTQFNTVLKGQTFYLVLSFGSNNGNGFTTINEFHTHENKSMTGTIYGRFTTTPPGGGAVAGN